MHQVELAAAEYLLSTYSSPCFNVKTVYNYDSGKVVALKVDGNEK
jgi:hypothetical protein